MGITAFEIDLFGRLASLTRAEQNRYFATEAAACATRVTLVGDIADAWLNYGANASLLKIAQDTATSAQSSVRLTRARLERGIAPRIDLRQTEQVLATAQADLAEQRTALAQDVNALQLLVGAPIDAMLLPRSIAEAAATVTELPAGLDSRIRRGLRGTIAEQTRATRALVAAANNTFRLTDARYRGGIDTFLTSLDAQRSLYSAQRTLVATELTSARSLVSLYRALGGDGTDNQVDPEAWSADRPPSR